MDNVIVQLTGMFTKIQQNENFDPHEKKINNLEHL